MSRASQASPFTLDADRLQREGEGKLFWMEPNGPDTLRFRSSRSLRISDQDWTLIPQPEEHLYGMGQYPNDCLELKGTVLELAQHWASGQTNCAGRRTR